MRKNIFALVGVACLAELGAGSQADAQQSSATSTTSPSTPAPAATSKPSASTDSDSSMSTIVVKGVPPDQQVLPTARPISSVMGQDMSIIDTPRSVSIITKQQLEDRQITSVQDLGQFSSGTYTPAEYGLDGIPYVRGIYAQLYQNGQQEIFYRNSVVPSFNQVESLDLVKGPGSAVYGPPGGGPGGYVNFITKAPAFDGNHTELETTIGDYAPGGQSWGHYEWTADNTGPLIPNKLAYRVSYQGTYGDTYYQNTKDDKEDIFTALSWLPTDAIKMDWTFQYYNVRDNQADGFNRPTQNLIDNQQYIVGPQSAPYGPITGTTTQKVYAYETIDSPYDSARGDKLSTQLITTYQVDPDLKIVNYQFYQRFTSRKYQSFGYDEYVPGASLYDTRTEVHLDYDFKICDQTVENHDIGGFSYRGQEGTEFSDFTTQPFNAFDLTQGGASVNFSQTPYAGGEVSPTGVTGGPGANGFGGYQIKGLPGYSAGLGFYDGTRYTSGVTGQYGVYNAALFYQHDTDWTKYFSSIIGVRGDYEDAWARLPTQYLEGYYGSDDATGTRVLNYDVFGSLIYKINPDTSFYTTFDRTHGFQGDSNFGGLTASGGATPSILRQESDLYEAGFKRSWLDKTLYTSVDGFYQNRVAPQTVGVPALVEARGVEADAAYQPNKNFSVTGNFTWMETNYHQLSPYEQTSDPVNTGVGTPNFHGFPTGNYEVPGIPKLYFNAFAVYKFDNGFGAGVGPQVQGEQNADLSGELKIPAQFTWNAEVFYRQPKWEVQLNIFNFTDERNFTVIDPTFTGNDAILEQMPLHMSGTFKYRF